ncbi:hypothetical protein GCM10025868_04110 [Angustibacter aerolatus]|uniref:Membrane transport protein MMPL domain-containing protein n=1 Tax=Angustibacter aerolatus TaxID=1162965 RepID=A0ABQ6JEF3_9ACTN|nr:hypothetical protein GCM10025868_04110 [Angustibacter aerolatus]
MQVVVRGDTAQAEALAERARALPDVAGTRPVTRAGDVAVLGVDVAGGDAGGPEAASVVHRLRALDAEVPTYVIGQASGQVDFVDGIQRRAPVAVGLVVVATFALLFLLTGSVLVPLKALVLNVVSLGASLGVVVLVFQDGWLEGPLGFDSTGGIETTIPPLVLAFAFGLAMDYEVFLLSRIKEQHDLGRTSDQAVAEGLQRSGRIITSAALLVIIVFAGLAAAKAAGGQADRGGAGARGRRRRDAGADAAGARDDDAARRLELVGAAPAAPAARPLRRDGALTCARRPSPARSLLDRLHGDAFVRWELLPGRTLHAFLSDDAVPGGDWTTAAVAFVRDDQGWRRRAVGARTGGAGRGTPARGAATRHRPLAQHVPRGAAGQHRACSGRTPGRAR